MAKTRYMPPVIPEIAKAFQNDPRTMLSQTGLATGASGAPVAAGSYAWGDGIARALQGAFGGYMMKKQMGRYGKDEQDLLALRAQRGQEGILGEQRPQVQPALVSTPMPPALEAPGAPPPPLAPPPPQMAPQTGPALGQAFDQAFPQQAPPPAPGVPAIADLFAPPVAQKPVSAPVGIPGLPPMPGNAPFKANSGMGGPALSPFTQGVAKRDAAPVRSVNGPNNPNANFVDPLGGRGRLSSGYGSRGVNIKGASTQHNGVDYAAPEGTPVGSAGDGVVLQVYSNSKGGNQVLIKHPDGSVTGYAHLRAPSPLQTGQSVKAGQQIGEVGRTGIATGDNLHFTYRDPKGNRADPSKLALGSTSITPGDNGADTSAGQVHVPDVPAPHQFNIPPMPGAVARPDTPNAQPATRSRTLDASYRMMVDGNRYESADAQTMYGKGLTEQGNFDESAAERKQRLSEMGYQGDIGNANSAASEGRQYGYNARQAFQTNQYAQDNQTREFAQQDRVQAVGINATSRQQEAGFGNDRFLARFSRGTQQQLQDSQFGNQRELLKDEYSYKTELEGSKADRKAQNFFSTPAGAKIYENTANTIAGNNQTISKLNAFESKLAGGAATGGFALGNVPGMVRWASTDVQAFESISNDLTIGFANDLKGALSDSDRMFVQQIGPSVRKTGRANREGITRLRGTLQRVNDFQRSKLNAMSQGEGVPFLYQWDAYTQAVPVGGPSFDEWKSNIPAYDAQGNQVNAKQGRGR